MRSALLFGALVASASTVLAADCTAQNIVDACVSGYEPRIEACRKNGNDWICLCDVYSDVLTCYNNCPNSNERSPVESEVTSYCTAAQPFRAAASASNASIASVARTATTAQSTATATASSTGSGSATGALASATAPAFATGAASSLTTPAGAAAVALFAAVGLF